jgi:ribosome biogenesis GTPase
MLPEREHVLAANIDQLVIVASYRAPKVRWALIDRYLVVAEEQDLPVTIVMTKEDLLDDEKFGDECRHHVDVFRSLGYRILSISMMERRRFKSVIQEIKELLAGKLTLLSGHSGVGKSSLVNLFKPEIVQEVEPEPDLKAKGRHTTTYASLIKLGTGGYVVDTPGVRSFAMLERTALEWSHGFREMRSRTGLCKFRECRHIDEPECAVLEAKERGEIDARRYQSYVNLVLGETGRQGRLRGQEVNEEEGVEEP